MERVKPVWRLSSGEYCRLGADGWRNQPLPLTIRCLDCLRETVEIEVPLIMVNTPIPVKGVCQGCGRDLAASVEFEDSTAKQLSSPQLYEVENGGTLRLNWRQLSSNSLHIGVTCPKCNVDTIAEVSSKFPRTSSYSTECQSCKDDLSFTLNLFVS